MATLSSATDSSIRLVQDPTTQAQTVASDEHNVYKKYLRPVASTPTVGREPGITINTSLEVASASPFSTESQNMASQGPTIQIQAPGTSSKSTDHGIRTTKSAGALKKVSSDHPRTSSFDEARRNLASTIEASEKSHPSATKQDAQTKSNNLPEFRQSRRWAKFHEPVPAPPATPKTGDPDIPLTMREASFEQQKAQPKTSLQSPRIIPRSAVRTLSETDSVVQAQGLCRALSVPSWHAMRAARVPRPKSLPTKWVLRKLSIRRQHRSASRQSEGKSTAEEIASTRRFHLRRRLRPKKAVADLRRKAGFLSSSTKLAESDKVIDLDRVSIHLQMEKGPSTPVPSLHDPAKAKRFSQECEALLTNMDFDKDWVAPSEKPLAPLAPAFEATEARTQNRPTTSRGLPQANATSMTVDSEVNPDSRMEARAPHETLSAVTAPEPPIRTSSKGGARLASIVHMTRPACIPILHGFRDGALIDFADASDSTSTLAAFGPTLLNSPTRMSSSVSRPGKLVKGPRPVTSTDTLTKIEAQMHDSNTTIAKRLKKSTAFIVGHKRTPTASSGSPPERLLPALPASETQPRPTSHDLDGVPIALSTVKEAQSAATASAPAILQAQPEFSMDDTSRARSAAFAKRLSVDTIKTLNAPSEIASPLPTPSSVYSQASLASRQSKLPLLPFTRHDITRIRPDRMRGLKQRVHEDLARERRISEEDEEKAGLSATTGRFTTAPVSPAAVMVADPIDQFPPVPESRPQSRTSMGTRRNQSRSRSHARHSSRTSSVGPRYYRQTLGTSEIKVLVDTNPVTGRFRAGALSPSRSIAGSSRDGSPVKSRRGLSTTSISMQEVIQELEQPTKTTSTKPSYRSLHSRSSSRPTIPTLKPLSHDPEIFTDSEEEISPLLSPRTKSTTSNSNTKKPRRRWNSNDIRIVQRLHTDLENYHDIFSRLEQELRLQREEKQKKDDSLFNLEQELRLLREEIRKSERVVAAIGRANGVREKDNVEVTDRERAEASSILSKELESIKTARSRKKPSEDLGLGTLKLRPISHISSASATTNVTLGSVGTNDRSMEGSMTDPLEYEHENEIPSSVSAPAGLNIKSNQNNKAGKERGRDARPGSQGSMSAALHRPPPVPVAKATAKGAMDVSKDMLDIPHTNPEMGGYRGGYKDEREGDDGGEGKENRLSVNHGFTDTAQMDRALEVFRDFA